VKTEEFLNLLEQRQLLPPRIVAKVREKLERQSHHLTSEALLKYLVQKELLGRRTAEQLLETVLEVNSHAESSILGTSWTSKKSPSEELQEPELPVLESAPVSESPSDSESLSLGPTLGITVGEEVPPSAGIDEEEVLSIVPEEEEPVDLFASPEQPDHAGSQLTPTSERKPEALLDEVSLDESQPRKKRSRRKGRKHNEWDSPLLLMGGGGLVVLLVGGLFIFWLLTREDADKILGQAAAYFDQGSYTQAIAQYEKFVDGFPNHPQSSAAKVHLGVAQLWKATQGTSQFEQALTTARKVLENIEEEPEFGLAQEDLASRLPAIADGLAKQAEEAGAAETTDRLVELANSALSLCANTKYISKTYRDETALQEVRATLARVKRGRKQEGDLQQALQQMDQEIAEKNISAAYVIHKRLLEKHSGLLGNELLAAKVLEISQAELEVVRFVSEPLAASTVPHKSLVIASLALAERRGPASLQVTGNVAVSLDGAIYGLRASDGSLLWRRFVGLDSQAAPVVLVDGDILAIDSRTHELIRLHGDTGKLRWRQALEGPAVQPVLIGGRILVATKSGKLFVMDPDSGERTGYIQFGQPLMVAPVMDREGRRIFVVGEQSSLYTLDVNDFSCLGVFYLGHARGCILVPPVALLNKLAVAINTGATTSHLRLLGTDQSGVVSSEVASTRLQGLVGTRLLTAGRRLVALTSMGLVAVYDVGSGEDSSALTLLARRVAEKGNPVARYGLLQKNPSDNQLHVWIAGTKLNQLTILPTGGRLPVQDIDQVYSGDLFEHPLQMAGELLIHTRRPARQAGAIVAAMDSTTGNSLWETELAVPLSGPPVVDMRGPQITATTASGAIYELDRAAMKKRVQNQARSQAPVRQGENLPLTQSLELQDNRLVFSAGQGARQLLLYSRDAHGDPLQRIPLASPAACPPVAWGDGVVIPTRIGQVYYFSTTTGQQSYAPFQPALQAGREYSWLSPAIAGEHLVLCDRRDKIYLLQRLAEPQPHLSALTEVKVGPSPLVTPLVVFGQKVMAGTQDGKLARFQLPELEIRDPIELGADIVWGPHVVADRLLTVTAQDELICLDSQGEITWRQPIENSGINGRPLQVDEEVLLLWQDGSLTLVELTTGKQRVKLNLDQPIVAGPVAFGKRVLLSTHDGTLLVVNLPQPEEGP
jgi:outer membrane protein assembly factor BamB/tetratricopeptide (TPR) repeat protein